MKEHQEWFEKAKEDFDTAKFNIEGGKINAGLFFLQQASEKALKAVYIEKNKSLIRVHDLVVLARSVKAPESIIKYCELLNPFYQQTRYPDTLFSVKDESYESFITFTKEVLEWSKKQLT